MAQAPTIEMFQDIGRQSTRFRNVGKIKNLSDNELILKLNQLKTRFNELREELKSLSNDVYFSGDLNRSRYDAEGLLHKNEKYTLNKIKKELNSRDSVENKYCSNYHGYYGPCISNIDTKNVELSNGKSVLCLKCLFRFDQYCNVVKCSADGCSFYTKYPRQWIVNDEMVSFCGDCIDSQIHQHPLPEYLNE